MRSPMPLQLHPDDDENIPYLGAMHDILALLRDQGAPQEKSGVLVDYGCGAGVWSMVGSDLFETVIGIDVLPGRMVRCQEVAESNGITNFRFINPLLDPNADIPPVDAMIAINVMPVIRSDHAHEMFAFAQRHLKPNGRFLISSYRAAAFLDQVTSLEYFSFLPPGKALYRYAATLRSALETIYGPRIHNEPRARAYHTKRGMIALGQSHGLRLAIGPETNARFDAFKAIDSLFAGTGHRRRVRWGDWFVFEKP